MKRPTNKSNPEEEDWSPTGYAKESLEFKGKTLAGVLREIADFLEETDNHALEVPYGSVTYNFITGPGSPECAARIVRNACWSKGGGKIIPVLATPDFKEQIKRAKDSISQEP